MRRVDWCIDHNCPLADCHAPGPIRPIHLYHGDEKEVIGTGSETRHGDIVIHEMFREVSIDQDTRMELGE